MITYLTKKGNELMGSVIGAESVLNFTKIQFSDGHDWHTLDLNMLREEIYNATELHHEPLAEVSFEGEDGSVQGETGLALLKSTFSNASMESGWHVTEIGVWAQDGDDDTSEVLYAVSALDLSKAPWIPPADEIVSTFDFNVYVYVGDETDVTAVLTVNAEKASQADLDAHKDRRDNPHEVTKDQVGLGNVPNVTTNDQTPTYEEPEGDVVAITSGEKLSIALGKIKKLFSAVFQHFANKNNPHEVTAAQINAASVQHYHNAKTDITSGILPVLRGGTGEKEGVWFDTTTPLYNNTDCAVTLWREYCWNGSTNGRILKQGGYVNCDSGRVFVRFNKPYKDTRYTLTFQTSGSSFIPRWKNVEKQTDGFYMNRTVGIDSTPIKNMLKGLFPLPSQSGIRDKIDEMFGASQAADWTAIGQAAD